MSDSSSKIWRFVILIHCPEFGHHHLPIPVAAPGDRPPLTTNFWREGPTWLRKRWPPIGKDPSTESGACSKACSQVSNVPNYLSSTHDDGQSANHNQGTHPSHSMVAKTDSTWSSCHEADDPISSILLSSVASTTSLRLPSILVLPDTKTRQRLS